MTDELPWLTLRDAAEARRNLIPSRRGNAGQLLVQVTGAVTDPGQGTVSLSAEDREEWGAACPTRQPRRR